MAGPSSSVWGNRRGRTESWRCSGSLPSWTCWRWWRTNVNPFVKLSLSRWRRPKLTWKLSNISTDPTKAWSPINHCWRPSEGQVSTLLRSAVNFFINISQYSWLKAFMACWKHKLDYILRLKWMRSSIKLTTAPDISTSLSSVRFCWRRVQRWTWRSSTR